MLQEKKGMQPLKSQSSLKIKTFKKMINKSIPDLKEIINLQLLKNQLRMPTGKVKQSSLIKIWKMKQTKSKNRNFTTK